MRILHSPKKLVRSAIADYMIEGNTRYPLHTQYRQGTKWYERKMPLLQSIKNRKNIKEFRIIQPRITHVDLILNAANLNQGVNIISNSYKSFSIVTNC